MLCVIRHYFTLVWMDMSIQVLKMYRLIRMIELCDLSLNLKFSKTYTQCYPMLFWLMVCRAITNNNFYTLNKIINATF